MLRRVVVALLLVLAAGGLWLLLADHGDETGGDTSRDFGQDDEGAGPGLTGRGRAEEEAPAALPKVEDPVGYVLSDLGRIPEAQRRAHLLALMAADPAFLQGLIDWVATPDGRSVGPPGVSTTATVEQYVHWALALIGEPAVAPLVELLSAPRKDPRYRAARALKALGTAASAAVEPLTAAARNGEEDRYVRAAALDALGAVGSAARGVMPFVHSVLRDPDCEEELGLACARNLTRIGGGSEEVFVTCRAVLAEDWYAASRLVLDALCELGPLAEPFVPDLLRIFDDADAEWELWGKVPPVLQAIGVADDDVLVFLRGMIRTAREEGTGDGGAARALAFLGEPGRKELIAVSGEGNDRDRLNALRLLQEGGLAKKELVAEVARFLREADGYYRTSALNLLAGLDAPASLVLPVVKPCLQEPNRDVRARALLVLGKVSRPPREVLDILTSHAQGKDKGLAYSALEALGDLALEYPDDVLAAFLKAMADSDPQVAWMATAQMAKLVTARPRKVVGAWLAALEDERIREMAVMAMWEHALEDKAVQHAFRAMAKDPSPRIRKLAIPALGKVALTRDFETILRCTGDADQYVRSDALGALNGYADRFLQRVLDALVAGLVDRGVLPRRSAAWALRNLGAAAEPALPAMKKARRTYAEKKYYTYDLDHAIKAVRAAVDQRARR